MRPGTYDITSKNYVENFDSYFKKPEESNKLRIDSFKEHFSLTKNERRSINKLIIDYNFSFGVDEILDFARKSLAFREFGKFEFTKSISNVFDLILEFGNSLGISREDLSFLNINDILNTSNILEKLDMKTILKDDIKKNKNLYNSNKFIHLPHIITSHNDINVIKIPEARPNYVTQGKISGETVFINNTKN